MGKKACMEGGSVVGVNHVVYHGYVDGILW